MDHAAAFWAGVNLADDARFAHLQPGFTCFASDPERFHRVVRLEVQPGAGKLAVGEC